MQIYCPLCGSSDFHRSHLRWSDFLRILRFKLPVRCRKCNLRGMADYTDARRLPLPRYANVQVERIRFVEP